MNHYLIVRHGEAEGNRTHRFIGQSNVPLSATGLHQAKILASRLRELPIARIVSSDLRRCVDTIRPTAEALGLPIETDVRLREIDNGAWRDLTAEQIAERWPALWSRYRTGADITRPNGETWADVRRRVVGALRRLDETTEPDTLVVVSTHGGPALTLASWAAGLRPRGNIYQVPLVLPWNASITTIRLPGPKLIAFNDVGHLPPELQHSADMAFLRS